MKLQYLSAAQIEADAHELLSKYTRATGKAVSFPVPIERIIDMYLEIPIEWESIPSRNGREFVSKVDPPSVGVPSRIVMNSDMRETKFRNLPGLIATAMGHELGHWEYHIDRSHAQQLALGLEQIGFYSSAEDIERDLQRQLQDLGLRDDDWWREWQAHTFMRHVLMPADLLRPLIDEIPLLTWPRLYRVRDTCNVTVSALMVQVRKLGIAQVEGGSIRDLRVGSGGQVHLSRR